MKWITRLCKIFRSEATADDTNAAAPPESNIEVEPTFPDIGVANRLFRELWKRCGGQPGVIVTTVGQLEEWTGMDRHKIRRDLQTLSDSKDKYIVVQKLTGHKREITVNNPAKCSFEAPLFDAIDLESDRAKLENDRAKLPSDRAKLPNDRAKLPDDRAKLENDRAKLESDRAKLGNDRAKLESDRAKLGNDRAKWKDRQDGRLSRSESGLPEVPEKQGSNAISATDGAPSRTSSTIIATHINPNDYQLVQQHQ